MENKSKTIIQCYPSPIVNASRILRETESLIKLGVADKIIICGLSDKHYPEREEIDDKRIIIRVRGGNNFRSLFKMGIIGKFYAFITFLKYCVAILALVIKKKPTHITVRRVEILPIGVLAKLIRRGKTKLIYAPHELESGREGISKAIGNLFKKIESIFIHKSNSVIVVNDAIKDWYKNEFTVQKVYSLKNEPLNSHLHNIKSDVFRDKFNIHKDDIIFIYQGVIAEARGINILLDAFIKVSKNKHIVFMGYGPLENKVEEMSKLYPNIHFQSAVHPEQIVEYTSGADIGIFVLGGSPSLSYQYSLPNKFGEYLIAGLPVLVSTNLIYLSQIVNDKRVGWSVDTKESNALGRLVSSITKEDLVGFDSNVKIYSDSLGWEFEEDKLFGIYNS